MPGRAGAEAIRNARSIGMFVRGSSNEMLRL